MRNFGLVLRNVVFFLFPVPFLLSFAVGQGEDWTATLAYVAVAVLVSFAVAAVWIANRRGKEP